MMYCRRLTVYQWGLLETTEYVEPEDNTIDLPDHETDTATTRGDLRESAAPQCVSPNCKDVRRVRE